MEAKLPMIHKVSFRNFKALRKVEMTLERFTVLVGPNSSGKSSVLEGLDYLSQLGQKRPDELFCCQRAPLFLHSWGAKDGLELCCGVTQGGIRVRIMPPERFPEDLVRPMPSSGDASWSIIVQGKEAGEGTPWKPLEEVPQVGRAIRPAIRLRLEPSKLAEPSYSEDSNPSVGQGGEFLATVLAQMALSQPDEFQQLQAELRQLVQAVQRIRFTRAPVSRTEIETVTIGEESVTRRIRREYMGDALVLDMKGAPSLPAHLTGEGTLMVLGLLAVLHGPARPRLVLIDDLEQGLHPKGQLELVSVIRNILEQAPNLQVVAATHSPYILDRVASEEVRILGLDEDGTTVCGRLDDHPDFERWKEEMTPGEFWMLFGEKWLSQQPAGRSSDAVEAGGRL
jgi:predicted ATPase